jgi:hypothetical protein
VKLLLHFAIALSCLCPAAVLAQEAPPVPSSATEPQGFVPEPGLITRATLFADRHLGKGDLTNGIYVDWGNMVPGAGWLSVGPGYRHWYGKDTMLVDASAAISVNNYRMAQARFELPKFLKSRLALGTQVRWHDFRQVDFFGVGPDTTEDVNGTYSVESTQLAAFATLRPVRWMGIGAQVGWANPEAVGVTGMLDGLSEKRTFVPTELSLTIDTRDFPGHPTSGIVLRGVGANYDDRTTGLNSFKRYEAEAAGFVPLAGSRVVLGLHGWMVRSDVEAGHSVPYYLQPSLGGVNTLRSYADYRFHDNNMLLATAEVRVALLTHLDFAIFADAGNVAARAGDLDLARRSYGGGFRLHTRRESFATMDVAYGDEGWRALFRLKDPLALGRLTRKSTVVPFVP